MRAQRKQISKVIFAYVEGGALTWGKITDLCLCVEMLIHIKEEQFEHAKLEAVHKEPFLHDITRQRCPGWCFLMPGVGGTSPQPWQDVPAVPSQGCSHLWLWGCT